MSKKKRLDEILVDRKISESLHKAKSQILAGKVVVDDHRIDKPGTMVNEDAEIRLKNTRSEYVSRGSIKLESALEKWPVGITNKTCIDVGASTGGFTDLLLQRGAKKVYCVDVGYNQLAYKLRTDPRVVVMERTHILHLDAQLLPETPQIATIDVSFISLLRILEKVMSLIDKEGYIYALIKPQFEVEPSLIEKGGIVHDEQARKSAVDKIIVFAQKIGLKHIGTIESPIRGADGNIEYLTLFEK